MQQIVRLKTSNCGSIPSVGTLFFHTKAIPLTFISFDGEEIRHMLLIQFEEKQIPKTHPPRPPRIENASSLDSIDLKRARRRRCRLDMSSVSTVVNIVKNVVGCGLLCLPKAFSSLIGSNRPAEHGGSVPVPGVTYEQPTWTFFAPLVSGVAFCRKIDFVVEIFH